MGKIGRRWKLKHKRVMPPWSDERKAAQSKANKGKPNPTAAIKWTGERNPNWKGGITSKNEIIRRSIKYRRWRKSVYERDKYTCVFCGKIGGNLEADHIKPFALFPELRHDIDNGRTLCIPCHKKTDTWGRKKPAQELSEIVNDYAYIQNK